MTANYNKNSSLSTIELLTIDSKQFLPVSIFKGCRGNTKRLKSTQLGKLIESITNPDKKEFIALSKELARLKKEDPGKYKELKETQCPAFIPGDFEYRKKEGCKKYAPLMGFDIDAVKDEVSVMFTLEACKKLPYVFVASPSPSRLGLRILVWTDSTPENHKDYYKAITEKLSNDLHIKTDKAKTEHIDTKTNDISRIWFFTHVPKDMLYVNWESEVFKLEQEKEEKDHNKKRAHRGKYKNEFTNDEKVNNIISQIEANAFDLTEGVQEWFKKILLPLANEYGEAGRLLAHRISKFHTDYKERETDEEYSRALSKDKGIVKIGTFLNYAMDKGIKLNPVQIMEARQSLPKLTIAKEKPKKSLPIKPEKKKEELPADDSNKPKFIRIKNFIKRRYDLRLNLVSLDIECSEKGKNDFKVLNENDLICELLEAGFAGVETPLIALLKSSFVPQYDPFFDYFENLPEWKESDPDHIEALANYIDAKEQDWFNSQFKKMLVRMAACALNKIAFNKQCFVLKGGQNDGKSSFVRFLCPPKLRNYITDHIDVNNKDGRLALCQNFIINLDELSQFPRADIRKVKSLITLDKVKERLPYDRKPTTVLRRASFLGSTNDDEFLVDETGNVRWLIMEIKRHGVNHDKGGANGYMAINIDLVYSQAYTLLKSGYPFELTKDELARSEKNNKNYKVVTVEQELIQDFFAKAKEGESGAVFLTATNILQKIQLEVTKTTIHKTNIGKALSALGFEKSQKWYPELGYNKKGYWVKELNSN